MPTPRQCFASDLASLSSQETGAVALHMPANHMTPGAATLKNFRESLEAMVKCTRSMLEEFESVTAAQYAKAYSCYGAPVPAWCSSHAFSCAKFSERLQEPVRKINLVYRLPSGQLIFPKRPDSDVSASDV